MKKLNSKFCFLTTVLLVLSFFLSFNLLALAQSKKGPSVKADIENKKVDINQKATDKICQRIDNAYSKLVERGNKLESEIDSKRKQEKNIFEKRVEERKQEMINNRGEVDENFEENISKMLSQAENEEEKEAVEEFRKTVEAAKEKRRKATDAARETFRETVRNQVQLREKNLKEHVASFQNSVMESYQKAKEACEKEEDIKNIRDLFGNGVKNARAKFQNEKQNREKVGEVVSQAAKQKNDEIGKANQEFQATLKKAIQKLKEVLGEKEVD